MQTYLAPDGTLWEVTCWDALAAQFELTAEQLPEWHARMVATPLWESLRQVFCLGQAYDITGASEPMSLADIAKGRGISRAQLERDIASCEAFWKNRDAHERLRGSLADPEASDEEGDPLAFRIYDPSVTEETASQILEAAGFHHIPPSMRVPAASRVLELKKHLEHPATRVQVRSLVESEVQMETYHKLANKLQTDIERLLSTGEKGSDKQLKDNRKELTDVESRLAVLSKKHLEILEAIGADELEAKQEKKLAIATMSYGVQAMQRYYAEKDTHLVDGVFTENELTWLLTPLELYQIRSPQYRPEIVASIQEAMKPGNLWNPLYEHSSPAREDTRIAHRVIRGLIDAQPPRKVDGVDNVKQADSSLDADDEDDADGTGSDTEPSTEGASSGEDEGEDALPPQPAIPFKRQPAKSSGEFGWARTR